ncbi:MAG: AMP-binding protein [Verrucomicrobia bacterium]|nr:AMP-binding protein [Verrucomicrobiota bacterium]
MNVVDSILAHGAAYAPAVLYRDAVLTYGGLKTRVAALASDLLAQAHLKGDRIGLFSENNPFFVAAYLGVLRAGLVAVPFPVETTREDFARIALAAGLKRVLVSARFERQLRSWASGLGVAVQSEEAAQALPAKGSGPFPEIDANRDLAALMFTSGSTGLPKGVMVTHRNLECNTRDIAACLELTAEDRVMVVLPFHYCFGLSLLHTHLLQGGSLVLNNDFRLFPEAVLRELQAKECTGFAGVPSTYQILLRKSRFRQMQFPRLRWLQQAGGKLPNACIQEIATAFPQVRFVVMYGQTEATARLSFLPPTCVLEKLGSIGKGLPSTKLEVIRPDGAPVLPGSEQTGEIVASGDNIALGYWNDPLETAKYFDHGRLRTGDLARVDAEGFIFIVEREREMIKSGGNRVSAKEVEDVIAELPEVVEVAVVGLPHELLGETILAGVVPSPAGRITPREVMAHCHRRLPPFKRPEAVVFLDALPHNSSGKILKPALRTLLSRSEPETAPLRQHWPGECPARDSLATHPV